MTRDIELMTLNECRLVNQLLQILGLAGNADIELAVPHIHVDDGNRMHADAHLHVREHAVHSGERRHYAGVRIGDHAVDRAKHQGAAQGLAGIFHCLLERLQGRPQADCGLINVLALRRERKTGAAAPAQFKAKPRFKRAEVAAHAGEAHAKTIRCRRQAAMLDDGEKGTQVAYIVTGSQEAGHANSHLRETASELIILNLSSQHCSP